MKWSITYALFLCAFISLPTLTNAQVIPDDPVNFITTWNTENPGTSNDNQITIPGTGGGYSYEIYWENVASSTMNGTTSLITTDSYTLTFPEPGIYEVQASGTFPRIYFNGGGDRRKILTVEQWGDIEWTSMDRAFRGCTNLRVPATDAPDLSGVTDMKQMFRNATAFNQPLNHWDVSSVTDMRAMFYDATAFNQPLNDWDVSSVTDMGQMFRNATAFNQPLNDWDVSSVTDMTAMFYDATAFNQDLDQWDTGNVTEIREMFRDARAFNGDITTWDTSSVENMRLMFLSTREFNQNISGWNTSRVRSFANMFNGADSFNQPIGSWNTASATDMAGMFRNTNVFNQPLNDWDVSNVTNLEWMFGDATLFNQPLDQWDTSQVANFRFTFGYTEQDGRGPTAFDQNLSTWDISSTTNMTDMFRDAGLSTENQNATLASWAEQASTSNLTNVPFHLGLKTYTEEGAAAIDTLESLGWTITEQYQAEYRPSPDATLFGSSLQSPIDSGATTTAVELDPDNGCTFERWSDGNTDNPRQDVLTDNLSVTAEFLCRSTTGTSARTQRDRTTDPDRAQELEERFLSDETTTSTPPTYTPPETLEESLAEVEQLPETIDRIIASNPSPETVRSLITILLALVEALGQLLVQGEG